jgi:hypothetical protein
MKAPERTTYIYRIVEKQRQLERVCPTINAAARFVAGELELNLASFRIEPHIDTEIPVGNRYVITSYLKWKSRDKQINEAMIEAANKPQHLRFTGFNFKFDENEVSI